MNIIKEETKIRVTKPKPPDYIKTKFKEVKPKKIEISAELLELMPELKDILVKRESDISFTKIVRILWNAGWVYLKYRAGSLTGIGGYALALDVVDFLLQKLKDYKKED